MKITVRKDLFWVLSLAMAFLLIAPASVLSDDQDQTQDRIREGQYQEEQARHRLMIRVQQDAELGVTESDTTEPEQNREQNQEQNQEQSQEQNQEGPGGDSGNGNGK
ncbi:MAG: hypothetical protein JSV26_01660 [bacterium]|nr:MAG: hypothetical protein JSV26_01660 [bacterium]